MDSVQKSKFLQRYGQEILRGDKPELRQIKEELNREICELAKSYFYRSIYEKYF